MAVEEPIGNAVLYVGSNVAPGAKPDFDTWCNTIHHFDSMRIEGFLSLRRFEEIDGRVRNGHPRFSLLTRYQVEHPENANFDTPSYRRHSATYAPAPDGVTDQIEFERTVYTRVNGPTSGTQSVGEACASLLGAEGRWLDEAARAFAGRDDVLGVTRLRAEDRGAVLIEIDRSASAARVMHEVEAHVDPDAFVSLQTFRQVFPKSGVLLRDRQFRT